MLTFLLICQIAISTLGQEITPSNLTDGPYIFYQENGSLKSISLINGEIVDASIAPSDESIVEISTSIPSVPLISIAPVFDYIPKDTVAMPPKLLAVSDIEGNLEHLLQFLQLHKVIDGDYDWAWDTNHLLFDGDSVDRGDQVTELLWFIRKLQQQAKTKGGQVHFVLGNHDVMIMADDIRYTHEKYKSVSQLIDIPYHEMFGSKSVLGTWLRNQNSIVQIGPYIFVHAGYSPELLALDLTHTEINEQIRASIGPPAWPDREELTASLAWHSKGPLWYRGYFDKHAEKYGPKPTDEQLQAILNKHTAKAIIVGHTVTGNVGYLDGNKCLIGIDVHWDAQGEGQGLLITEGGLSRLSMKSASKELVNIQTGEQEKKVNTPAVSGISPSELQELLTQGTIVLIDVREVLEFEAERIPQAVNLPLSEFDTESVAKIANGKEVVFHCRSGHRSGIASKKYFDGRQSQKHLDGGIIAWKKDGLQTITN